MTTTVTKVILTPRERQILEGLADGSMLAAVALHLHIREGTASEYLKLAKRKLHGVSETTAALAVAYATEAITQPQLLGSQSLHLLRGQRELVPLVARGMTVAQMATDLKRRVDVIRRDGRQLLVNLQARNPAHLVTRAWQYQILTAEEVIEWLRRPQ
ncbi:LuxR C-terminal-related transcriptional regulator [Streptomyces lydicus]|uniref:LuxR C-terminal-related transcriptional regulator n=1 Tax=Streptomyces lydicus TaxID=47763 RepID=UPI0037988452